LPKWKDLTSKGLYSRSQLISIFQKYVEQLSKRSDLKPHISRKMWVNWMYRRQQQNCLNST